MYRGSIEDLFSVGIRYPTASLSSSGNSLMSKYFLPSLSVFKRGSKYALEVRGIRHCAPTILPFLSFTSLSFSSRPMPAAWIRAAPLIFCLVILFLNRDVISSCIKVNIVGEFGERVNSSSLSNFRASMKSLPYLGLPLTISAIASLKLSLEAKMPLRPSLFLLPSLPSPKKSSIRFSSSSS